MSNKTPYKLEPFRYLQYYIQLIIVYYVETFHIYYFTLTMFGMFLQWNCLCSYGISSAWLGYFLHWPTRCHQHSVLTSWNRLAMVLTQRQNIGRRASNGSLAVDSCRVKWPMSAMSTGRTNLALIVNEAPWSRERRRGPVVRRSLWTRPARVRSPWEARIY